MKEYVTDRSYEAVVETQLFPENIQSVAQLQVLRDGLPIKICKEIIGLVGGEPVSYKIEPTWLLENKDLVFDLCVCSHVLEGNNIALVDAVFQVRVVHLGLEFRLPPVVESKYFHSYAHVPCRVSGDGQLVVSLFPLMKVKDIPLDPRYFKTN